MQKIKTHRLLLRYVRADDAFNIHEYAKDESITMMLFYPHSTMEETREYIERSIAEYMQVPQGNTEYLIEYEGSVIGEVCIDFVSEKEAELGWLVSGRYRGMGIATEAARALIDLGASKGITRFFARCDGRNGASERVMQKLGMTLCGIGTRTYPKTGETATEKTYELIM